jgi:large subunit ribosomal protein L33
MAVKKTLTKMACGTCKTINYFTKKSKKLKEQKLALKKFCKGCKKHTAHKESKR